jgi:hypothetical protein
MLLFVWPGFALVAPASLLLGVGECDRMLGNAGARKRFASDKGFAHWLIQKPSRSLGWPDWLALISLANDPQRAKTVFSQPRACRQRVYGRRFRVGQGQFVARRRSQHASCQVDLRGRKSPATTSSIRNKLGSPHPGRLAMGLASLGSIGLSRLAVIRAGEPIRQCGAPETLIDENR